MSVNNKRVFYVQISANQIYAEMLQAPADVRLSSRRRQRRGHRRADLARRTPIKSAPAPMSWQDIFTSIKTCYGARRIC